MGEHGHLSGFFILFFCWFFLSLLTLPSPLFSLFFNLYPRISIPIQLKMTAQFCGFHLPSSFYWGLAPYLALGIIHILMGSFPVTAHGTLGVRLEPWPLMRHAEICHWQKSTENTGIHLWWWELCLITFRLFYILVLFPSLWCHFSFLPFYPYQFQGICGHTLLECCMFYCLTHTSFV